MSNVSYFTKGINSTAQLSKGTNISYQSSGVKVLASTEIDRWYTGDFVSADYIINVELSQNERETIRATLVAMPGHSTLTIHSRTALSRSLINVTASATNSHVSLMVTPYDNTVIGSNVSFFGNYARTTRPIIARNYIAKTNTASWASVTNVQSLSITVDPNYLTGNIIVGQLVSNNLLPTSTVVSSWNGTTGALVVSWTGSSSISAASNQQIIFNTPPVNVVQSSGVTFKNISVSGQDLIVATGSTDTLTFAAGTGIGLSTTAVTKTLSISNKALTQIAVAGQSTIDSVVSGSSTLTVVAGSGISLATNSSSNQLTVSTIPGNAITNLAVSGQNTITASSSTDTLTFVAGTGITLSTNSGTKQLTIAAAANRALTQIIVAGQSTIDSTVSNITSLTVVAGNAITLATNSSTNQLTINNKALTQVAVPGQSTIDSVTSGSGTLTIAAGTGISLITDALTNQLTISTTGGGTVEIGATTSAGLAAAITDETGNGYLVFNNAPTLVSPIVTGHPRIEGVTSTGATGTNKFVFDTSPTIATPTITGGTLTGLTGLAIRDTSAAFDVTLAATSSTTLTAGRTLTIDVVNAARTIKLAGNLTTAGNLITAGGFSTTLTTTADTNVTLPTSGTLYGTATGSITSAQMLASLSDETGTGALVFNTSPSLTSPAITTSLTTASTTFALVNTTATTVNFAGAATTIAIGGTTGTLTIGNPVITATRATTLNMNGASPSIVTTSTGTASVFNTNALTGYLFGAATTAYLATGASTLSIGSTSGTTTINNNLSASNGAFYVARSQEVIKALASPGASATLNWLDGSAGGAIWYVTTMTQNFTAAYTNIPTTTNWVTTTTLVLVQGNTAYIPNAVSINGVTQTIKWAGGTQPTGTALHVDIVSFTFIATATSTYTVIGALQDYS